MVCGNSQQGWVKPPPECDRPDEPEDKSQMGDQYVHYLRHDGIRKVTQGLTVGGAVVYFWARWAGRRGRGGGRVSPSSWQLGELGLRLSEGSRESG